MQQTKITCEYCGKAIESRRDLLVIFQGFILRSYHIPCYACALKGLILCMVPINSYWNILYALGGLTLGILGVIRWVNLGYADWVWFLPMGLLALGLRLLSLYWYERHLPHEVHTK